MGRVTGTTMNTEHALTIEELLQASPGLMPHEVAAMRAAADALRESAARGYRAHPMAARYEGPAPIRHEEESNG